MKELIKKFVDNLNPFEVGFLLAILDDRRDKLSTVLDTENLLLLLNALIMKTEENYKKEFLR